MKAPSPFLGILFVSLLSACSGNGNSNVIGSDKLVSSDDGASGDLTTYCKYLQDATPPNRPKASSDNFYGIKTDPTMSTQTRAFIAGKLKEFENESFKTENCLYQLIFQGNDNSVVLDYIQPRVNFIASGKSGLSASDVSFRSADVLANDGKGITVAYNIGLGIWITSAMNYPKGGVVSVRGVDFPITSSRLGVIQLGDAYFENEAYTQVSTLAHEGRHSDCTGGVSAQEMKSIRNGGWENFKASRPECGHVHSNCPAGHDLAGEPACDAHQWGAYSVDVVFYKTMKELCAENKACPEKVRQTVDIRLKDSMTRLAQLSGFLAGKWGRPDMETGPIGK